MKEVRAELAKPQSPDLVSLLNAYYAMQEAEGVTEALKAADQLEWVRRMNGIRNRAEEIVKAELIFV